MLISIRNFGTIAEADVKIGGLTVIAGENDTGKSTVGKILFSLIKASARYQEDLKVDKESKIISVVEKIYFSLRRNVNLSVHPEIRDLFHPIKFYNQVMLYGDEHLYRAKESLKKIIAEGVFSEVMSERALIHIDEITELYHESDNKEAIIRNAVIKAFYSEFRGEISPKSNEQTINTTVNITDGESALINIELRDNALTNFSYLDDFGYQDATFVDTPAIIQFNSLVSVANTLFDTTNSSLTVPLHIKDLSNKLMASIYSFNDYDEFHDINRILNYTYKGKLYFDKEKSDFVLERGNYKVSASNVASGIKSLGLLQMLVHSRQITDKTILILDEPEVNLHPKWQIEYANIIVELVKAGANIIVTTHSPYILEALKTFSDKFDLKSNFYLAKKNNFLSNIFDVTNNVGLAFSELSEPLIKLNEGLDDEF
jgi:predicted ATPase